MKKGIKVSIILIRFIFILSLSCLLFGGLFFLESLKPQEVLAQSDVEAMRNDLLQKINELQREIDQYQNKIGETQQKSKTLQNQIDIFDNQIAEKKLTIKQIDFSIKDLDITIGQKNYEISDTKTEINGKKEILAEYIRTIHEYDQENLLEIILKEDNLSDFLSTLNTLENIQEKVQIIVDNIEDLKDNLENQKIAFEEQQEMQYRLRNLQTAQQKDLQRGQNQKGELLKQTKGQEKKYQDIIVKGQKDIEFVREQLSLLGKYNLSLEEAIQDAIGAGSKSGIRPAFLLGVLEAESRLGQNVGTGTWQKDMYECYIKLAKYYDRPSYLTKAEREKNAFFQICQELQLNPNNQPVSAEPYYGCGGAMGVGQFMPTTWLAYKNRVAQLTGHNPPNPWNPQDAFMAAAIKLADAGADQRTELGERTAYSRYLAGNNWQKWLYSKETNYVIKLTENFQKQYFQ